MDQDIIKWIPEIAIAAAIAWGAGIRLYAVLLLLGFAATMGWIELPTHLKLLAHPLVMGASGLMAAVELFADKVPWIDSVWDAVHTFIRIPAGAALAAAVFGDSGAAVALAAGILGGTIAAGAHLSKAGARGLINASPEPLTNWGASTAEDLMVPAGLWLAFAHPFAFLLVLAACTFLAAVFLYWLLRKAFDRRQ